jgi:hypothetical protein
MKTATGIECTFCEALVAAGRSTKISESDDVYGWLVGRWDLDVYRDGLPPSSGEVHFCWVLEGLAVQDVWIMPKRSERTGEIEKKMNRYGTTLRVWDPSIQSWRVTWINPVTGVRDELIGRWSGRDIVQIGSRCDGTPIRWNFTEITRNSFRWTGESLLPDGKSWKLEAEFRGRRVN